MCVLVFANMHSFASPAKWALGVSPRHTMQAMLDELECKANTISAHDFPCGHATKRDLIEKQKVLGEFLALCVHCVHIAHAEAGILTQIIRLVVTVLFPQNPFQKNEQSKNI